MNEIKRYLIMFDRCFMFWAECEELTETLSLVRILMVVDKIKSGDGSKVAPLTVNLKVGRSSVQDIPSDARQKCRNKFVFLKKDWSKSEKSIQIVTRPEANQTNSTLVFLRSVNGKTYAPLPIAFSTGVFDTWHLL